MKYMKITKIKLQNFLDYIQDKVKSCYKHETKVAIERFLKGLK